MGEVRVNHWTRMAFFDISSYSIRRLDENWTPALIRSLQTRHPTLKDHDKLMMFKRKWQYMYVYMEVAYSRVWLGVTAWTMYRPVSCSVLPKVTSNLTLFVFYLRRVKLRFPVPEGLSLLTCYKHSLVMLLLLIISVRSYLFSASVYNFATFRSWDLWYDCGLSYLHSIVVEAYRAWCKPYFNFACINFKFKHGYVMLFISIPTITSNSHHGLCLPILPHPCCNLTYLNKLEFEDRDP